MTTPSTPRWRWFGHAAALLSVWATLALPARAGEDGQAQVEALRKALKQPEAPARARALAEFARGASRLTGDAQKNAARLLKQALEAEDESAVRVEAVHGLARLVRAEAWIAVLLASREDRDDAVRRAARLELLGGRSDLLAVIAKLLAEDEDPTFRADLLLVLRDRRRADAVPLLLGALRDPHGRVVAAAAEALEAITGEAQGYDAEAWARRLEERARAAPPAAADPPEGRTVPGEPAPAQEPTPYVTRSLTPDFLGLTLTSKDLVFVVDVSGSVGAGRIDVARRALERAVDRLGSDARFTALFFAEEVQIFRPSLVPALPRAKEDLHFFLRGLAPGRKSDVYTPVHVGLDLVKKRLAEKQALGEPVREAVTLIVVSDGRDNMAKTPPALIAERLERLDLAHAVVHALVLGGEDNPFMRALAERTGGRYLPVMR